MSESNKKLIKTLFRKFLITILTPANAFLRSWKPYNPSPGFQTIGHKKIDRVEPVVTNKIRFVCKQSVLGTPEIRKISVYKCEPYDSEQKK